MTKPRKPLGSRIENGHKQAKRGLSENSTLENLGMLINNSQIESSTDDRLDSIISFGPHLYNKS